MKKYLSIILFLALGIPLVAFASWWNPFTWFKKTVQTTKSVSTTTQPTIEELTKKVETLQKQIDDENSIQAQNQKTTPKIIQSQPKQSTVSVQTDSTLTIAKCKGLYDVKIGKIENEVNVKLVNLTKEIGDEMGINLFALPEEIKNLQARQRQIEIQMLTAPTPDYSQMDPSSIIRASNARGQEFQPALSSVVREISRKANIAYAANKALEEAKKTIYNNIQQQYNEEYLVCLNQ